MTTISVTCVIMQKNGAGLHTASSCFWDNQTDGKLIVFVWKVTEAYLLVVLQTIKLKTFTGPAFVYPTVWNNIKSEVKYPVVL